MQEISAFGEGGRGDTGDVWTVMCEGDYWTRDDSMMLKHVDTGMYLAASGHTFGRPIQGQVYKSKDQIVNSKAKLDLNHYITDGDYRSAAP